VSIWLVKDSSFTNSHSCPKFGAHTPWFSIMGVKPLLHSTLGSKHPICLFSPSYLGILSISLGVLPWYSYDHYGDKHDDGECQILLFA